MPSFKHLGPAMPEVSNFSMLCKDSLLAKSNEAIFLVTYNQRFTIQTSMIPFEWVRVELTYISHPHISSFKIIALKNLFLWNPTFSGVICTSSPRVSPCPNLPHRLLQHIQKMTADLHAGRLQTGKLDGYFFCFKLAKKLKQPNSIHLDG